MFYILSTHPKHADMMNCYERIELDEVFGEYNASQIENGIAVFANGGIHVNAFHAAKREADDFLMNGGA